MDEKFASNYKNWEGFVYGNPKKVKLSVEVYIIIIYIFFILYYILFSNIYMILNKKNWKKFNQ